MRLIRLIIIGPTGNTSDGAASCRDQRTGTVNLTLEWHPPTSTIHQLQDLSQLGRAILRILACFHYLLLQLLHLRCQQEVFALKAQDDGTTLLEFLAEAVCILCRIQVGWLSATFTLCPGLSCTMGDRHATTCTSRQCQLGSMPALG